MHTNRGGQRGRERERNKDRHVAAKIIWLVKDSVTRWIFFGSSRHFNQYILCVLQWFSRSFKSYSLPWTLMYKLCIWFFENTYWFWKCLLIPSSAFHSPWLVYVLQWRPLIDCRDNAPNLIFSGGFGHNFTGSKAAFVCVLFQGQNSRFRVSEEGSCTNFQN